MVFNFCAFNTLRGLDKDSKNLHKQVYVDQILHPPKNRYHVLHLAASTTKNLPRQSRVKILQLAGIDLPPCPNIRKNSNMNHKRISW